MQLESFLKLAAKEELTHTETLLFILRIGLALGFNYTL